MSQALTAEGPLGQEDRATPWLGMIVALASWAMMFAALFLSYVLLRVQQRVWPPLGTPALPVMFGLVNTVVLLASSGALAYSVAQMRKLYYRRFIAGLWAAIALGAGFLLLQLSLWQRMHEAGLSLGAIFGSIFYVLTWFHAFHIVAGLGALLWLAYGAARHRYGPDRQVPVMLVSAFWHFLDVMWICMFVAIFLV